MITQIGGNFLYDLSVTNPKLGDNSVDARVLDGSQSYTMAGLTLGGVTFTVDAVTGALTIQGDLAIQGTQTVVNSTQLAIDDPSITLNKNGTTGTAVGSGIDIEADGVTVAGLQYDVTYAAEWYHLKADGTKVGLVDESSVQTLTSKVYTMPTAVGGYGQDLQTILTGLDSAQASGTAELTAYLDTTTGYVEDAANLGTFLMTIPAHNTSVVPKVYVSGIRLTVDAAADLVVVDSTTLRFAYDITNGGTYPANITVDYIPA